MSELLLHSAQIGDIHNCGINPENQEWSMNPLVFQELRLV